MHYHKLLFIPILAIMGACTHNNSETSNNVIHNVFIAYPESIGGGVTVSLPGTIEEGRTISVGFKTPGQIEHIYVKEGQRISKGQLIAILDSEDYAIGVANIRERLERQIAENARIIQMHASGNLSDNEYEKALSGQRQLELQLRLEENHLSYCRLTAPASGVVTKVNFEDSEMVDAGTPIIDLMDSGSLEAVVDIPVKLYAERTKFIDFTATSSMMPGREVKLSMLSLTPRADNTQLYRLRLAIPSKVNWTPGMNIMVNITLDGTGKDGVRIPLSALFNNEAQRYVWVVNADDSTVNAHKVNIISDIENGTVVVNGNINCNDMIVRAGVRHLIEGEKVKVINEESDTNPGNLL